VLGSNTINSSHGYYRRVHWQNTIRSCPILVPILVLIPCNFTMICLTRRSNYQIEPICKSPNGYIVSTVIT